MASKAHERLADAFENLRLEYERAGKQLRSVTISVDEDGEPGELTVGATTERNRTAPSKARGRA